MKLWEKKHKLNKQIEEFTVGNDYLLDQRLVKYDCKASIAHAKMLHKMGILKKEEARMLVYGLEEIVRKDSRGEFKIKKEDEDCHTAIENYLTKNYRDAGKKIHTARSRNDQVLGALRLYYKDELKECKELVSELNISIKNKIKEYSYVKLPGYTHTRKAMPSSIKMWLDSFAESMKDNLKILDVSMSLIDQCPLGTGAGYGLPIKVDRKYTAKELGFAKVQKNPVYVQNSRGKFESTILHGLSQIMCDLNKISTDLIMFSMPEFGYFELPKEICTGSSIMPHKSNPDVLELVRGAYHEINSYESRVKDIIGNLISGYNRDLQLTKEPVMKGFDKTKQCLSMMNLVVQKIKINKERCKEGLTEELFATEKAYELVKKGMPFREAYKKVSEKY